MKKYALLIVATVAGISTLLTNLLSIDAALSKLAETRIFAYMYLGWDLFKLELAVILVVVLIHRFLARLIAQAARTTIKSVRTERPEKTFWHLAGGFAIVAVATLFIAYQGYYLTLGKYSMWIAHDRSLVRRAADFFLRGEHAHAKLLLSACNTVYGTCRDTEANVNRRMDLAAATRKLSTALPKASTARPAYALTAYALDRDWNLYQNDVRSLRREFNRANALWLNALQQLQKDQTDSVMTALAQLQDVWPGFADSHDLLEKLRNGRPAAIAVTVKRLGAEQVAKETGLPFAVLSLDRPALSPLQQAQLPGGLQGELWDEYGFDLSNSFKKQAFKIAYPAFVDESGEFSSPRVEVSRQPSESAEQPAPTTEPIEPQNSIRGTAPSPVVQPTDDNASPETTKGDSEATTASFACERDPALLPADGGVARIAIDAGHGGIDRTIKMNGIIEGELALDISLRLAQLLRTQPQTEVLLTRGDDTFIPLEERTAIANREKADLFISIHSNESSNRAARGVETYFLNFAGNQSAEATAARENSRFQSTDTPPPELIKAIALQKKRDESREFANYVHASLVNRLKVPDLGVKSAPFIVLIGTQMPSILVEIGFLSNKDDATLLKQEKYRQDLAEALCGGVVKTLEEGIKAETQLKPVFFRVGTSVLTVDAQLTLDKSADVLRRNPKWIVTIEGHADEDGSAEENLALGEKRAMAAKNYLVSVGISGKRLRTVSYGKEFPFEVGRSEIARGRNRRAHLMVTAR